MCVSDSKSRTPMDLIQEDFPATPSSIYNNRLFAAAQAQQELDNADDPMLKSLPSGLAGRGGYQGREGPNSNQAQNSALDHATMAMQNLYVSGVSLISP